MKLCPRCRQKKTFDRFHKNRSKKDGYSSACIDCRKQNRRENPEVANTNNKRWRRRHPKQVLLYNASARARRTGVPFTITVDDFEIPDFCPVFKIPLISSSKRHDGSPTLDRVDNTRGYVKGNVVVVSWLANRLKSDASVEELRAIVAYMEKHQHE